MKLQQLIHPESKYRPDIDGLRAIAVLSVIAHHAFPNWATGGFIGVDVFFVISGYLISTILFKDLENEKFEITHFYTRRIKRIFPALILVLIACLVSGWFILLADEYKQLGKHIASSAGFILNFILWNEEGYFNNSSQTKPLLHLWSLGVEEQFYIIWPLLLWFFRSRINLLLTIIIVAICSFAINYNVVKYDSVGAFYLPHARFWELLSGSLLAWVGLNLKSGYSSFANKSGAWNSKFIKNVKLYVNLSILANFLSISGSILLIYGILRIDAMATLNNHWAAVPVIASVIIIAAGPSAWINRKILSSKILVWFGLISYPLYLWHWPFLSFASIIEGEVPNIYLRIAAVLISVLLAYLTFNFVERPVRFGRCKKSTVAPLIIIILIVGSCGYNVYYREGYEHRSSIKEYVNNKNELIRTQPIDNECLEYTKLVRPLFHYCRFTNVNSNETVAIIGDSHAHVAYPGIAEYLTKKNINTVLLANSSCPPFMGSYTGNNQAEREACKERMEQLLGIVSMRKDISKVFIFSRGPTYITGTEPSIRDKVKTDDAIIPIHKFANSAQLTFNRLANSGKKVFYITENPELNYSAGSCVSRPFRQKDHICSVEKSLVLERQSDYLKAFSRLKNVTLIKSIDVFCPKDTCEVFDEDGVLLYADADHLSIAGSKFQASKLIIQYID